MGDRFSGRVMRDTRRQSSITAEQLALTIGRSVYAVHAYERGAITPPLSIAARIADALGISITALLTSGEVRADALR